MIILMAMMTMMPVMLIQLTILMIIQMMIVIMFMMRLMEMRSKRMMIPMTKQYVYDDIDDDNAQGNVNINLPNYGFSLI